MTPEAERADEFTSCEKKAANGRKRRWCPNLAGIREIKARGKTPRKEGAVRLAFMSDLKGPTP